MYHLEIEGRKYVAKFQNVTVQTQDDDSDDGAGDFNVWNSGPKMWWYGTVLIAGCDFIRDVRAHFETYHRKDVEGGISEETLEESLMFVRGRDEDGIYVSHRNGGDVITNRKSTIDYLLAQVYYEGSTQIEVGKIIPSVSFPLLEQHVLAELGYALPEPEHISLI